MPKPKHKRWYVLAVAALIWIVCLWGLQRPRAARLRTADAQSDASAQREADSPNTRAARNTSTATHAAFSLPALHSADLIAKVDVDKPRLCSGESFLVSIRGKPENARSTLPIAELNYNIGGRFGETIALDAGAPGTQHYTVVASNGVDKVQHRAFDVEVLPDDARECRGKAIVTLAVELSKQDPNQVVARAIARTGLEEPLHYAWSFGDGVSSESAEPSASHSYALRDQQRTLSSYVVKVLVSDARGRRAEGRATIHLMNNHYRARMFGARLVQAVYTRFVEPAGDAYRVQVTFRSFESEPVALERAKLTARSCLAGRNARTHELAVSELGAALHLEPGQSTASALLLPKSLVGADTCAVELELTGDTIPARTGQSMPNAPIKLQPVRSRLSLDVRAAPSVEQGGAPTLAQRAVRDPTLLQKLRRAAEILGTGRITPEQLERLDREGRLAQ